MSTAEPKPTFRSAGVRLAFHMPLPNLAALAVLVEITLTPILILLVAVGLRRRIDEVRRAVEEL